MPVHKYITDAKLSHHIKTLVDSHLKRSKTFEIELFIQRYRKEIPILDTEYIAIISANPEAVGFLAEHINLYRTIIRPQLKDISLYRIGAYMQIFSAEETRIEDIIVEQHNWRLSQKQRQTVIDFLVKQFGIVL